MGSIDYASVQTRTRAACVCLVSVCVVVTTGEPTMEPPGHSPPLRAPPATSTTGANMAAEVRDGVSGGDASPKEHAQRRSDGDPTAGGQPVPGAAAATDNTEVADARSCLAKYSDSSVSKNPLSFPLTRPMEDRLGFGMRRFSDGAYPFAAQPFC